MKKNLMSAVALVLALASLLLSCVALLRQPETAPQSELSESVELAALITELQAENESLKAQLEELNTRLDSMDNTGGSAFCHLFVEEWEEEADTLVLTSALLQVQLPSGAAIDTAQLVLIHNGAEIARADLMLQDEDSDGIYQLTLTDTWFPLPELAEDDMLDIYPEILLSTGMVLSSASTSWYYTAEGLYTAVG